MAQGSGGESKAVINNVSSITSSDFFSGSGVQFTYQTVNDICEKMITITKDIDEQFDTLRQIYKEKDSLWRGMAANKFFTKLNSEVETVADTTTNAGLLGYIEKVKDLVNQNKQTDKIITDNDIATLNQMLPNIKSLFTTFTATAADDSLYNKVNANDNINSNNTTFTANSAAKDLYDKVMANDNVSSNNTSFQANTADKELYDQVSTNDNVISNSTDFSATAADKKLYEEVGGNQNIGSITDDFVKIDDQLSKVNINSGDNQNLEETDISKHGVSANLNNLSSAISSVKKGE